MKKPAFIHPQRFRLRHVFGFLLLFVVVALIVARIYLPVWLKDYANKTLNNIDGYRGSVEAVDVNLLRGAYTIRGLVLKKIDAGIPVPFLNIATSDISLQWGALLRGHIVSDVHLTGAQINFAKSKSGTTQTGVGTNWFDPIKQLAPIDINVVEIRRSQITYQDFSTAPKVDLRITNVNGQMTNLRNVDEKNVALPATLAFSGTSIGDGAMKLSGRFNPLTRYIDMDIDGQLEHANLTAFNDFSSAYAGIHFKEGTMSVYSEVGVQDGRVRGYVKPLIRDLSVDRIPDESNPLEVLWSTAASVLLEILHNQPRDQLATKVPLTGTLDRIETPFWPTLGGIFRNAFIKAFSSGTDNEPVFGDAAKKTDSPEADTSEVPPAFPSGGGRGVQR